MISFEAVAGVLLGYGVLRAGLPLALRYRVSNGAIRLELLTLPVWRVKLRYIVGVRRPTAGEQWFARRAMNRIGSGTVYLVGLPGSPASPGILLSPKDPEAFMALLERNGVPR